MKENFNRAYTYTYSHIHTQCCSQNMIKQHFLSNVHIHNMLVNVCFFTCERILTNTHIPCTHRHTTHLVEMERKGDRWRGMNIDRLVGFTYTPTYHHLNIKKQFSWRKIIFFGCGTFFSKYYRFKKAKNGQAPNLPANINPLGSWSEDLTIVFNIQW